MSKKRVDRKSDTSSVKDAINAMFNKYHLKPRFDEMQLVTSWPDLMGKTIANKTGKIFIKNEVLFVEISSAPLKHELNMSKNKVMKLLENEVGPGVISEILFI